MVIFVVSRTHSRFGETRQECVSVGHLQSRAAHGHTAGVDTGSHQSGTKKPRFLWFVSFITPPYDRKAGLTAAEQTLSHIVSFYLCIRTGIVC